jgi:beta-lactamase class A
MHTWIMSHKELLLIAVTCIGVLIVTLQMLYPVDKALPFARLNDQPVAGAHYNEIAATIQKKFQDAKIHLVAGKASYTTTLASIGANPNTDEMVMKLTNYSIAERLVPFSLLFKQPNLTSLDVYFDEAQLQAAGKVAAEKLSTSPEDARLAIDKGVLVATSAKPGYKVGKDGVISEVTSREFAFGDSTIHLTPTIVKPSRVDADIAPIRAQAEAAITSPITLIGPAGEHFLPDNKEVASWLIIKTLENNAVELAIDSERVAAYVASLNDKLKIDPGVTKVSVDDGQETSRAPGSEGVEVDTAALIKSLQQAVMVKSAPKQLTISMKAVLSAVVNDRRYSATQKGLQAYVDYATSIQNVHISLVQLNGEKWTVSGRASESIPSASTYKLFVALVLFDRIDKGEIHWSDAMLDTTVAGCFERMTVASTNPCAEKWIAMFGRQYINEFIYGKGFSTGTSFTTNSANQTTANDLTKFMTGLNDGTLVSGANRDRLLDSLGRHPYRYGVPTGSRGDVHDKVGFLWDYVHDTAIVNHPKGTYIVTIMTKGQSYARIAQITRELERIMYP